MQLMSALAAVGPPNPREDPECCSILHGLVAAVESLCKITELQHERRTTLMDLADRVANRGRIICLTNAKRYEKTAVKLKFAWLTRPTFYSPHLNCCTRIFFKVLTTYTKLQIQYLSFLSCQPVFGVLSTGYSPLGLFHSDTPLLVEYRSFYFVRLSSVFLFFPSDTHVRMLEDYIQETILDQNKLAAGSDRYDKMRCCSNDCVCMLVYQLFK